ncbi:MAG: hypothetical protein ACTSPB_26180 [Candidatus Thorarchaeota archaeon]
MDSYDIDRIKQRSNVEVVRRLLIKYFIDKGFTESFDRQLYPSIIQDLPATIPALASKLEIVPHVEDLDVSQGKAVLGWDLFVLGFSRMYLGETYHNNLQDLARQVASGSVLIPEGAMSSATRQTTPRRIIHFITRVFEQKKAGYIDLAPTTGQVSAPGEPYGRSANSMGQHMFSRSGYGT